ncbi:hypothetical protein F5148DRAFT_1177713 [Russula earlei]|uniref:Uncharacterized protein n=1 Tax=Russula earlei TaxID=71964 RepID=A0ACC0UG26_9AGAM|nr:hypothetical protein F5148DRAFT_1177713 [Russula earlei]
MITMRMSSFFPIFCLAFTSSVSPSFALVPRGNALSFVKPYFQPAGPHWHEEEPPTSSRYARLSQAEVDLSPGLAEVIKIPKIVISVPPIPNDDPRFPRIVDSSLRLINTRTKGRRLMPSAAGPPFRNPESERYIREQERRKAEWEKKQAARAALRAERRRRRG